MDNTFCVCLVTKVLKQCGAPPASLAKVYTTVVRPALEYAAHVQQNIPDFLSYKIESIQKRATCIIFPLMNYNVALNALNLTTLCERRAHLCQVYIDRLQNENHPLHLVLPKWEEFKHNYSLRSSVSSITLPSCRTTVNDLLNAFSLMNASYLINAPLS